MKKIIIILTILFLYDCGTKITDSSTSSTSSTNSTALGKAACLKQKGYQYKSNTCSKIVWFPTKVTEYNVDNNGNATTKDWEYTYEYDPKGNQIKSTIFIGTSKYSETIDEYDANSNVTKTTLKV